MPGENIQDWSVTAANNASADTSINFAEGQPRASVNNSARSLMAAHAKDRNLKNGSIVTSGTADAQEFTSGVNYTVVPTGLRVLLKIGTNLTNTAPVTLNMDGIGAVRIKYPDGSDVNAGALVAGSYIDVLYSGATWILLDSIPFTPTAAAPPAVVLVPPLAGETNPKVVLPASPAATVEFTHLFEDDYNHYLFDITFVPSASAQFAMRLSLDNGVNFISGASDYTWSYMMTNSIDSGAGFGAFSGFTGPGVLVGPTLTAARPYFAVLDLYAGLGGFASYRSNGYVDGTGAYQLQGSSVLTGVSTAIPTQANAIRFFMGSGNFTSATIKMFGAKSA